MARQNFPARFPFEFDGAVRIIEFDPPAMREAGWKNARAAFEDLVNIAELEWGRIAAIFAAGMRKHWPEVSAEAIEPSIRWHHPGLFSAAIMDAQQGEQPPETPLSSGASTASGGGSASVVM